VSWAAAREIDLKGFNIVEVDDKEDWTHPKYKSGRNIFVEFLRLNGTAQVFGPAVRQ